MPNEQIAKSSPTRWSIPKLILSGILAAVCMLFAAAYLLSIKISYVNVVYDGLRIVAESQHSSSNPDTYTVHHFSIKTIWILYSLLALCGSVLFRKLSQRKRPLQISLRAFLVCVLVCGIILPTGYYYARQVQQRREELSRIRVAGALLTYDEHDKIMRNLRPLTLWEAIWHNDGSAFGPVHNLNVVRPVTGTHNYQSIDVDGRQLKKPTYLFNRFAMGDGTSGGLFDFFPWDVDLSGTPQQQNTVRLQKALGSVYDLQPNESASLVLPLKPGNLYKVGATGNWFGTAGNTNTVRISMRTKEF